MTNVPATPLHPALPSETLTGERGAETAAISIKELRIRRLYGSRTQTAPPPRLVEYL